MTDEGSSTGAGSQGTTGMDDDDDDDGSSSTGQPSVLDPNVPPGQNFDLQHWKITLPDASELDQQALVDGAESQPDFFTDPKNGGMVFACPNDGNTTSSSTQYARSELREMLREPGEDVSTQGINANNWVTSTSSDDARQASGGVDGSLQATLSVDAVSTTHDDGEAYMVGRVIVGQIHAPDDEPCKIYYRLLPGHTRGSVYWSYEPENGDDIYYELIGSRDTDAPEPDDGIALGERWSYSIDVVGHDLTVTITREDGRSSAATHTMSGDYDDAWLYFKAGVYNQNSGGDEGDGVQATFFALEQSHAPPG